MRTLLALVVLSLPFVAPAQVYRCGNTYSDEPCKHGREVDVSSPVRSSASRGTTTSIHLCKSYGGAQFWSSQQCSKHGALTDRIENVPSGVPWEQQVEMARSQFNKAAVQSQQAPATARPTTPQPDGRTECQALESRVLYLDAQGRVGGSPQFMDWLRAERQKARDQQFRLRC